jgi:HTH-type transcriptional regulator / antitoxin HigA
MAILNQRDWRLARTRALELERARKSGGLLEEWSLGFAAELAEVRRDALTQEHERLLGEIADYEKLRGREASVEQVEAVDLGLLPIIARISRGWSQRHLADLLGLKEQQIQRYEMTRYSGVSLSRYKDVLEAIGVELNAQFRDLARSAFEAGKSPDLALTPVLWREIQGRGWIESIDCGAEEKVDVIRKYLSEAALLTRSKIFHRQQIQENNLFDDIALMVWQARVLNVGAQSASKLKGRFNLASVSWIPELVALSVFADGPRQAVDFLKEKGVLVVIERHLSKTRLDGAAMLLATGCPVIGLTLRYDRLDYFWYTLLHELGHIFLHFNRGLDVGFVDDVDGLDDTNVEREADLFARTSLIPDEVWNLAPVRFSKSVELAKSFAASRGIHVAIVAGRLRHERKDFSRLGELVGQGQVRRLFA